jgi:dipeptidyl aminopeptidase/acylaminoacyl peptidase
MRAGEHWRQVLILAWPRGREDRRPRRQNSLDRRVVDSEQEQVQSEGSVGASTDGLGQASNFGRRAASAAERAQAASVRNGYDQLWAGTGGHPAEHDWMLDPKQLTGARLHMSAQLSALVHSADEQKSWRASLAQEMSDLRQLLRVRSAYGGRFDAGNYLVFVSDLGGVPQVWGMQESGWPELLVAPPDRAQTVHPGPRAGQLVVGADIGGNEHTQLLYCDELGAPWRTLTDNPDRIHSFGSFAPDASTISFAANTRDPRWFDIYWHDLATGAVRCVLEHDSSNQAGPFSPDGRWLVVVRSFSNAHKELWLVDVQGGQQPRLLSQPNRQAMYERPEWSPDGRALFCLTDAGREYSAPARFDVASGQLAFVVEPDFEIDEYALDPTGERLAYAVNRDGEAEIVVRELGSGSERSIDGLPPGALYEYWQHALAWDSAGQRLAISWTASRANPNVFIASASDGSSGALACPATQAGGIGLDPSPLVEPEHVSYPTFDGRQIPALFYPSPTARKPAPCVVFVHGGPEGQYRPTFQPVVQGLVSAGFAVLAPNVRGSSGYGRTYLHLDDVRKRMDSVADLAYAVAWLRTTGRADEKRIAVYGGSYGGFMVLATLTTNPELWAAGVDLVGIANFATFLENTGPWRRHLREAEYGSLEDDREFLEVISPINHVERIRAPLLVIHGANDPRVPIGEAEQMVSRLRSLGRTVEFLRLEDEGHQIAKLNNKLLAYPMAVDFLQRHLMGETSARDKG